MILFSEKEGGEEEERSLEEEEEEEEEEAPDIVMAWNMAKYLPEDGSIQVTYFQGCGSGSALM
jgi:hypothetical protein